MKENKEIKEAGEKLKVISEDEKMQRIAELKQKAIMDRNAEIDFATEKKAKEIAKKMKEEGIEIQVIRKVTGLTEEEIKEL